MFVAQYVLTFLSKVEFAFSQILICLLMTWSVFVLSAVEPHILLFRRPLPQSNPHPVAMATTVK